MVRTATPDEGAKVNEARLYCVRCGSPAPERRDDEIMFCRTLIGRDQVDDRPILCHGRRFTTSTAVRVIKDFRDMAELPRQVSIVDGKPDAVDPIVPFELTERDKILLVHAGIMSAAEAAGDVALVYTRAEFEADRRGASGKGTR
jgi:hypothetical protein